MWVLVPSQSPTDPVVTWDESRVSGPEPLAVRVGRKLRADEALITEYSGARLRMDLDRVPLWRGDHVGLKQLWSDYSQYLYLPRLRDSAVLLAAVRSGVALLTWNPDSFAYASAVDEATGRYSGLVGAQHPAVVLDAAAVLVKPEVAAAQIDEEQGRVSDGGVAFTRRPARFVPPRQRSAAPVRRQGRRRRRRSRNASTPGSRWSRCGCSGTSAILPTPSSAS